VARVLRAVLRLKSIKEAVVYLTDRLTVF